jgi:hypothetical protein
MENKLYEILVNISLYNQKVIFLNNLGLTNSFIIL